MKTKILFTVLILGFLSQNFLHAIAAEETYLNIPNPLVNIPAEAGSTVIVVNSNVDYTIENPFASYPFTPRIWAERIENSSFVMIHYKENTSLEEINELIYFHYGDSTKAIYVIQAPAEPYLKVTPSKFSFSYLENGFNLTVETNLAKEDWNAGPNILEGRANWIKTLWDDLYEKPNEIYFAVKENNSGEDRSTKIFVAGEGCDTIWIALNQRKRNPAELCGVIYSDEINISGNTINLSGKIENSGDTTSGLFYVKHVLAKKFSDPNLQGYKLGNTLVENLAEYDTAEFEFSYTLDEVDFYNLDAGEYEVFSIIDYDNRVEESREENNSIGYSENFIIEAPKACEDENEPNNSFFEAHSFWTLIGSTVNACFSDSDDKEYFHLSNNANDYYFLLEISGLDEPLEYSLHFVITPDNLLEINVSFGSESSFTEAEIYLYNGTQKLITKSSTSSNSLNLSYVLPEKTETSVEGLSQNKINIFPNPANDFIILQTSETPSKVELLDFLGKEIPIIDYKNKILLEGLKPGIYFLRVYYGNNFQTLKFIKS